MWENAASGRSSLLPSASRDNVVSPLGLTAAGLLLNILQLMSANVPELLDAWRMVAARRCFDGQVNLAELTRLQGLVADTEGQCTYALEFAHDDILRVSYVELTIETALPLICQRSLQRFLLPVSMVQRLGLIRSEEEESSLPEGYEPWLVPEDGMLRPLELVEDELVLAVPVVPLSPDGQAVDRDWAPTEEEISKANPFAALAALKKQ
jgi:uncharacterized protein